MQNASFIRRLIGDENGTTAMEYALIGALVAVAIVGSVRLLGTKVTLLYDNVSIAVAAVATAATSGTTGNSNNGNTNPGGGSNNPGSGSNPGKGNKP